FAMPISSRTAADIDCVCFWANSPRILEERSATCCATRASSCVAVWLAGCIPHEAISACGAPCFAGVVKIVQVSDRLTHREEGLMRIKRSLEQHRQQLPRAAFAFAELLLQFGQALTVMRFELRDTFVRAAKRLAMRRQDEHVRRQCAIARDGGEEEAQRGAWR